MGDVDNFLLALGLLPPWKIRTSTFCANKHRLEIFIDSIPGTRLPCPACGTPCPLHDCRETRWRHLDFSDNHVYLTAQVPRITCASHRMQQTEVPWADAGSSFTMAFERRILEMASSLAIKRIAEMIGEREGRIWKLLQRHQVDWAQSQSFKSRENGLR